MTDPLKLKAVKRFGGLLSFYKKTISGFPVHFVNLGELNMTDHTSFEQGEWVDCYHDGNHICLGRVLLGMAGSQVCLVKVDPSSDDVPFEGRVHNTSSLVYFKKTELVKSEMPEEKPAWSLIAGR